MGLIETIPRKFPSDLPELPNIISENISSPTSDWYKEQATEIRADLEQIRKDEIIAEDIVNKTIIGSDFIIYPKK